MLDDGESLTGTPTVTEMTTSDLTISNESVSTAELVISGSRVPAGKAAQFKALGQQAATVYKLKVSCTTDATPAQTLVVWVRMTGVDES